MKIKNVQIAKTILLTVGIAGVLVIAMAAPNALSAFGSFVKRKYRYNKLQTKKSLEYLARKGLIVVKKEADKTFIKLTEEGRDKYRKLHADNLTLPVSKQWGGKWYVACFDIPEKYKANREAFMRKLKELGFVSLQKSVLVWPHYCGQEVELLSEAYEVLPFVRFMIVEKLDKDKSIRERFGLN